MPAATRSDSLTAATERVDALQPTNTRDCRPRLLRAMLDYLPTPGVYAIISEISSSKDDEELRDLAQEYVLSVFKPVKLVGGNTPVSCLSSDSDSTDNGDEHESRESPSSFTDLESICLRRDRYQCIVTKQWSNKTPDDLLPSDLTVENTVRTKTCHIIPFCLPLIGNTDESARTWTLLGRIFPFPALRRLADNPAEYINHPSNVFTISASMHAEFGAFDLTLEPVSTQVPDTYHLKTWGPATVGLAPILPENRTIQIPNHLYSTPDTDIPLPDQDLFRVHHAICEILHASGLNEVLEEFFDEYYSSRCLASDGSTNLPFLIEAS